MTTNHRELSNSDANARMVQELAFSTSYDRPSPELCNVVHKKAKCFHLTRTVRSEQLIEKRLGGAGVSFFAEGGDGFGERLGTEVAFGAVADGDGAGFGFFGADHEHVGDFLHLGVADFGRQLFAAIVEMDADVVALERFSDVLGVVGNFFADRADFDLYGSEPEREGSGVVLDENTEEALDGAEQRAMNHERLVARAIFGDVFAAAASGQIEIELHSGELPGAADGVD